MRTQNSPIFRNYRYNFEAFHSFIKYIYSYIDELIDRSVHAFTMIHTSHRMPMNQTRGGEKTSSRIMERHCKKLLSPNYSTSKKKDRRHRTPADSALANITYIGLENRVTFKKNSRFKILQLQHFSGQRCPLKILHSEPATIKTLNNQRKQKVWQTHCTCIWWHEKFEPQSRTNDDTKDEIHTSKHNFVAMHHDCPVLISSLFPMHQQSGCEFNFGPSQSV